MSSNKSSSGKSSGKPSGSSGYSTGNGFGNDFSKSVPSVKEGTSIELSKPINDRWSSTTEVQSQEGGVSVSMGVKYKF